MTRRKRAPLMEFKLRQPCVECPFDPRNNLYLEARRAEEIAEGLEHSTFACHMTVQYQPRRGNRGRFIPAMPQQHCAGALTIMLKNNRLGDMQQVAERVGLWISSSMNLDAVVFDSFGDFIRFYGGRARGWGRRGRNGEGATGKARQYEPDRRGG